MTWRFRVAESSFVGTAAGPCVADALQAGDDVCVIGRDGSLQTASCSVAASPASDTVRLLTQAGDVELVHDSTVVTSTGVRSPTELMRDVLSGIRLRVEVLSPHDLPKPKRPSAGLSGLKGSLAVLGGRAHIPWPIADHQDFASVLEGVMQEAGPTLRRLDTYGWLVVEGPVSKPKPPPGRPAQLAAEAPYLSVLLAWEPVDDRWTMRVPGSRRDWLRRLLAALASVDTVTTVSWSPTYCPVEAQVKYAATPTAMADVVAATTSSSGTIEIAVDMPGSLVVNNCIIGAVRR